MRYGYSHHLQRLDKAKCRWNASSKSVGFKKPAKNIVYIKFIIFIYRKIKCLFTKTPRNQVDKNSDA